MKPLFRALPLLFAVLLAAACGHDDIRPYSPLPPAGPQPVALGQSQWLHLLDTVRTVDGTPIEYNFRHLLDFRDSATGLLSTHIRVAIDGVGIDSSDEAIPFEYVFDSLRLGTLRLATQNTATGADTVRVVDFVYQRDPEAIRFDDGTLFVPAP